MNAELERDLGLETYKPEQEPEPEPTLTLRGLVAQQLAGWIDVGVEYTYEDGDANPPLIYLYDALECPNLHRELDRVVAECEIVTFVFGLELGGLTAIGFAGGGNGSSSSSAASNRQPNEAEAEAEKEGDNAEEIKGIGVNQNQNENQVLQAVAVAANAASVGGSLRRQPPQLHIRFADGGTVWIVPD
jgi:hypothetical protein